MTQPKIMSDFDSTLITKNSLNLLTIRIVKYFIKTKRFGKLIKKTPILWTRLRELYTSKKIIPEILIVDDSDLVIKKAKQLKGIPYSIYKEIIPELEYNRKWIFECIRLQNKYNLENEIVTIVSRNGVEEIDDFLKFKNKKNIDILNDKIFIDKLSRISKRKYGKVPENITNREVLEYLGIKLVVIANQLCKKLVIIDNKKDFIYTGIVRKTIDLGVIERKNKALLYENNIVLADKEEKMYTTWAKEFVCVQN